LRYFFKEKQNSPIKDGNQLFDTSEWTRFITSDNQIQTVKKSLTIEDDETDLSTASSGPEASCVPNDSSTSSSAPFASSASSRYAVSSNPSSSRSDTTIHNSPRSAASLKFYGFLDPAVGKSTTSDGDYAAIVTVAKAPDGTLYVWNVWMEKVSPLKQVEQMFVLNDIYHYEKFGFESNGFQETLSTFIHDEMMKRKKTGVRWRVPIEKHINTHSKHSRISLLEPHILAGNIQFQADLKQEFYVQADEYNGARAAHDDGLDALASCVEMIRGIEKPIRQIKTIRARTSTRSPL